MDTTYSEVKLWVSLRYPKPTDIESTIAFVKALPDQIIHSFYSAWGASREDKLGECIHFLNNNQFENIQRLLEQWIHQLVLHHLHHDHQH